MVWRLNEPEVTANMPPMNRQDDRDCHVSDGTVLQSLPGLADQLRIKRFWFGLFLAAATLLAYWPAWFGQPIWDDDAHITRPDLRSLTGLARIWIEPGATQQFYPLTYSAFWVQHKLWGDSPAGYHLTNILLHTAAALLLLKILLRLEIPGAWLAAVVFALHPVQVESVAWISELKNTLSGVFYFAAALVYFKFDQGRNPKTYLLSLGLFLLALLSKTVTATLPAAILLVIWWKRGSVSWLRDARPLVPFFGIGAAAGLFTAWLERTMVGARGSDFDFTLLERCLIAGRALWFYLGKLFWPAELVFIYPRWPINAAIWQQFLYPLAVILLLGALWALRNRLRGPLTAFLFFGVTLFPALGFLNVYPFAFSFVADHFQYLASTGVFVLGSAGLALSLSRWRLWAKASGNLLCGTLLATLAGLTWNHASDFRDEETIWRDTLAKNPDCWLAHNNWAIDLTARQRLDEAASHYRAAIHANPGLTEAMLGLGIVLAAQGRADEARDQYLAAVSVKPDFAEAHNNLSNLSLKQSDVQLALGYATEAIRLKPDYAEAHYNLGNALNFQGKLAEAVVEYTTAVQLKPEYPEAHYNLGGAQLRLGYLNEASMHFSEVVRLQPANAAAHGKLALALAKQGKVAEAIFHSQEALRLQPDLIEALRNLAWIRATHRVPQYRDGNEAVRLAQEAVRLAGEQNPGTLDVLAAAYAEAGRFAEATAAARQALTMTTAQNEADGIRHRLELYKINRAYRDESPTK